MFRSELLPRLPHPERPQASSFPGNPSRHLSIRPQGFELVCEHLGFIWTYFTHPLARCVLRNQKSLRELVRVLTLSVKLDAVTVGILGTIRWVIFKFWECSKIFSIYINGNCFFTFCHVGERQAAQERPSRGVREARVHVSDRAPASILEAPRSLESFKNFYLCLTRCLPNAFSDGKRFLFFWWNSNKILEYVLGNAKVHSPPPLSHG